MNPKAGFIILIIGLILAVWGGYMLFGIPLPQGTEEEIALYLFEWFIVFYLGLGLTAFSLFYLGHGYHRRSKGK